MKKIAFLLVLLLVPLSVVAEGVIDVNLINQDPDPVEPGENVDIRWKMDNLGDAPLTNIEIEILPEYPFSLAGDSAYKSIRTLNALQKDETGFIFKYALRVDPGAFEGTEILKLRYKSDTGTWTTREYSIDIRTVDANLGITSVDTEPDEILPGETFELKIKVKNLADSVIKDVSVKIDTLLTSISGGSATSTKTDILDAVPFAPLKSATEKKIRTVNPGQEVIFDYSLIAYSDAEAKVYKIPLVLTFFDGQGNSYTKYDVVGIVVSAEPEISVMVDQSEIEMPGDRGEVTVKFVNRGLTDVKFVNIVLGEDDNYEIISSEEVYIGNIDSDDYETADFEIYVKPEADSVALPITYEYMDTSNNKATTMTELDLHLCKEGDVTCSTNGQDNKTMTYVIIGVAVVLVLLILFAIFRRRKK